MRTLYEIAKQLNRGPSTYTHDEVKALVAEISRLRQLLADTIKDTYGNI